MSAHAQSSPLRDGNWWNGLTPETKAVYMVGFFDGMELGKNFSIWNIVKGDVARGKRTANDATLTTVVGSYNYYVEKYMKNVS
jgi:hypothetical protein